jgi:hypothetical protein
VDEGLRRVNWTAVLVGTGLAYALAMVWFGKLFGRIWAKGSHDIQPPARPPVLALAVQMVGTFLMAWVIGATATINALVTAMALILAIASLQLAGGLFGQKSLGASLVDGGYVVAAGAVMILCQGMF